MARAFAAGLMLAACGVTSCGVTPSDAAQLTKAAGIQRLRTDLRPIRGTTRLLVIALDGVGDEALQEALRSGALSQIAHVAGPRTEGRVFEHAYAPEGVLSILPSTTMAAWSTVYTGEPAAIHGVPGNEWFDREAGAYRAPAPVSVSGYDDATAVFADGWLGEQLAVPTVFERLDLRSHVSMSPIHRGADLLTTPRSFEAVKMISVLPEGLLGDHTVGEEAYRDIDDSSVGEVVAAIERHGLPDVQVVYFPGVDLLTHESEQPLEAQRAHLREVIDPGLERILSVYREQKALEHTFVLVVSDHGHTPVPHDEAHALSVTDDAADPPAALRAAGFRVRPAQLTLPEDADFSAALAYQGGIAYVYVADRSTCPEEGDRCDWSAPARFEEDVLEAARAFYSSNRDGSPVAGLEDTLDLVLARRPVPPGEEPPPFSVFDGEGLVTLEDHLEAHPNDEWEAFAPRLRALAVGPHGHRAGDVLLVSRMRPSIPLEDRTYFSGPYHSWHGSPSGQDSRISLMVLHADRSGAALRTMVEDVLDGSRSQERVTPLIERLLAEGDRPVASR